MISRQEAAKMLDITPQSVSNWVKKGLLTGHLVGGVLLVDRNTIEQYFDSLQQLGQCGDRIAKLLPSVVAEDARLNREIKDISKAQESIRKGMPRWLIDNIYSAVIAVAGDDVLNAREASILYALNRGDTVSDISQRFCLTRERVMQLVNKSFRKIYAMRTFSELRRECIELRIANQRLRSEIDHLTAVINDKVQKDVVMNQRMQDAITKYGGPEKFHQLIDLLGCRLIDMNLSVRALNCLKSLDIETMADLVKITADDVLKVRNFGKKTFVELKDFLSQFHLTFGTDVDELYQIDIMLSHQKA